MRGRATRMIVLWLLLGSALPAWYVIRSADLGLQQLERGRRGTDRTLDRLLSSIDAIATVQQVYAARVHSDVGSLTRVSLLVDRLTTDAAGLRAADPGGVAATRLEEFWTALSSLMNAERRARAHLAAGDAMAAAELLLDSSRPQVETLEATLRAFHEAEHDSSDAASAAARWRWRAAIVATASLWGIGLVVFTVWRSPLPQSGASAMRAAVPAPADASPATVRVDLSAVAALASDLARLDDSARLPDLLERACTALRARGAILWLDSGEALRPVVTHGYDRAVLRYIRPMARTEDNATAAAWRLGSLQTVAADLSGYGALVAPLLATSGAVGALAIEVPDGTERDSASQAVATVLAALLSVLLAPQQAASPGPAAEQRELHRDAAAS